MTENLAPLADAELDLVGAGTTVRFRSINVGNVLVAKQGNFNAQGSVNVLTYQSGNNGAEQVNNASIG